MFDEVIQEWQRKGLGTFMRYKLFGKAHSVFDCLNIMGSTQKLESDNGWWGVRAYIIAYDMDKSPTVPIEGRMN